MLCSTSNSVYYSDYFLLEQDSDESDVSDISFEVDVNEAANALTGPAFDEYREDSSDEEVDIAVVINHVACPVAPIYKYPGRLNTNHTPSVQYKFSYI